MANDTETLADIVAELRGRADGAFPYDVDAMNMLEQLADRIEAAAKRAEDTVGNAAAMREALECAKKKALYISKNYTAPNSLTGNILELLAHLNSALSAPPRNKSDIRLGNRQLLGSERRRR